MQKVRPVSIMDSSPMYARAEKEQSIDNQITTRCSIEDFKELGLVNEKGLARVNKAIGYFCNNDMDLDLLEELFSFWRDQHEYIVLRRFKVDPRTFSTSFEYVAVKCSKRGNDVYVSRIRRRFRFLNRMVEDVEFFKPGDFKTDKQVRSQILWITLTYDSKRCSRREAWENIGQEWNRFISAMRRRYGKISHLRAWEGTKKGYPHIHAVLWFQEAKFSVFPHFNENKGRLTYRIKEKRQFEDLWHSYVDVEAISCLKKACAYITKYQLKVNEGAEAEGSKGVKTLAFMWLFRKRSYAVSGSFRGLFSDLIRRLRNSNMVKKSDPMRQIDLNGQIVEEASVEWGSWEFVGVFSAKELGLNPYFWAKKLNHAQIEVVLRNEA